MKRRALWLSALILLSGSALARANEPTTHVDIPAQPLSVSLKQFADQTGLQLAAETSAIEGKNAPAVKGDLSTQDVLDRLLKGTGLSYKFLDSRTIAVSPIQKGTSLNRMPYSDSTILLVQSDSESTQSQPSTKNSNRAEIPKISNVPDASREASGTRLEEIIVTARKHKENLQLVPVAVTAISGEQLKEQSVKTVANLQNLTPGLFVQQAIDDPQSIILTMRGRKQDDATMAVDSSVSLNVDGLYIPRTIGMAGSMLDIDRVEVLRGPQGTLYGRNTTGGAIGIFTKDPTHDLSGSVDVTGGNYRTWNVVGIVNAPIADNLDARFVAQSGGNGGYEHTTSGTPLNDARSEYFRGKLRWIGSNSWQAVLSAHYEDDRSGGARSFVAALDPPNFQGNGLPEGGYLALATQAELGVSQDEAVNLLKTTHLRFDFSPRS